MLRLFGGGIISVAVAFGVNAVTEKDSNAATKFTAYAGGGARGISVEMFRPKDILIHAGDTVEWVNPYEEIHTVTFLAKGQEVPALIVPAGPPAAGAPPKLMFNPEAAFPTQGTVYGGGYANSGILEKGQTFAQTFNQLGTYAFLCILHPGMEGTVQVLDAGTTVPSQAAYDADAKVQLDKAVAAGEASADSIRPLNVRRNDGTTNWNVVVPASVGLSDVMRFVPLSLDVGAGDTVTWNNNTFVPHTVTSTNKGAQELVIPEPQAGGPPNLVINPAVLFPSGPAASTFDGSAYSNSGFFGVGPESTAGPTYALTFTKPGSYLFVCVLHADQGMTTLVNVGGARSGGAVSPPSTGDGGLADSAPGLSFSGVVAGLGVFLAGGAALVLRASRR
jgi:plastocyanin